MFAECFEKLDKSNWNRIDCIQFFEQTMWLEDCFFFLALLYLHLLLVPIIKVCSKICFKYSKDLPKTYLSNCNPFKVKFFVLSTKMSVANIVSRKTAKFITRRSSRKNFYFSAFLFGHLAGCWILELRLWLKSFLAFTKSTSISNGF